MSKSKYGNCVNIGDMFGIYYVSKVGLRKSGSKAVEITTQDGRKFKTVCISDLVNNRVNTSGHNKNYGVHRGPNKKPNTLNKYKVYDTYAVGKATNTGLIFYLDIEDYNKVKDIHLASHSVPNGKPFICNRKTVYDEQGKKHTVTTSLLSILNFPKYVNFRNGNSFDFRRSNIETVSSSKETNVMNLIKGVHYSPCNKEFIAKLDKKYIKSSKDLGECIKARLEEESKQFGTLADWKQELLNNY